jgi:hypothetical protein
MSISDYSLSLNCGLVRGRKLGGDGTKLRILGILHLLSWPSLEADVG